MNSEYFGALFYMFCCRQLLFRYTHQLSDESSLSLLFSQTKSIPSKLAVVALAMLVGPSSVAV